MDILIRYGFSIEEIKDMMDTNQDLESINDNDVLELINILIDVGCHEEHIMNIFTCNPLLLSRDITQIKKLIKKLKNLKFKKIYMLLDSNPYLLNMNEDELEKEYNDRLDQGLSHEEVIDYFYHNTVI